MNLNSVSGERAEPAFVEAHSHSIRNRDELLGSDTCGCFYCLATFAPKDIQRFVAEREGAAATALCPVCGIDSVIGSMSGYPITKEFLAQMEKHWFGLRESENQ